MKAVIPAAGMGTRFLPMTKSSPKEMLPLVDKPAIQYVVEEAVASGITDVLIITGRGKRAVEDHFDRSLELEQLLERRGRTKELGEVQRVADLANIHYIRQKEPLGLGHAILCARDHVGNEPFAVLLGDDVVFPGQRGPCTAQLIDAYERNRCSLFAVQEVPAEAVHLYGIMRYSGRNPDGTLRLDEVVEKPQPEDAPSRFAAIGRYVFTPALFDALERTPPGLNGEIQIADGVARLMEHEPVGAFEFDGRRFDLGTKLGWLESNVLLALERPEYRARLEAFLAELPVARKAP